MLMRRTLNTPCSVKVGPSHRVAGQRASPSPGFSVQVSSTVMERIHGRTGRTAEPRCESMRLTQRSVNGQVTISRRRTILEQARHLSPSESVLDAIAGSFPSSCCQQLLPRWAGRESRRPSGMPRQPDRRLALLERSRMSCRGSTSSASCWCSTWLSSARRADLFDVGRGHPEPEPRRVDITDALLHGVLVTRPDPGLDRRAREVARVGQLRGQVRGHHVEVVDLAVGSAAW